jgi:hypothetical protein
MVLRESRRRIYYAAFRVARSHEILDIDLIKLMLTTCANLIEFGARMVTKLELEEANARSENVIKGEDEKAEMEESIVNYTNDNAPCFSKAKVGAAKHCKAIRASHSK